LTSCGDIDHPVGQGDLGGVDLPQVVRRRSLEAAAQCQLAASRLLADQAVAAQDL
jgi:hypothetical protein